MAWTGSEVEYVMETFAIVRRKGRDDARGVPEEALILEQ
jgi:hypothetical protein